VSASSTRAGSAGRPSVFAADAEADERRRHDLRRMKVVASGLLVLAAAVYALTVDRGGALGFVNAAAEAAMVGAIADWFAVTAIFRRPLGLPIPHTALIPTRKAALGRSLQEFVATHFLAEDVVRQRVAGAAVGRRAGEWLAQPAHAGRVSGELSALARGGLRLLKDDQVTTVLEQVLVRPVLAQPWGPPAGRLLHRVVDDRSHARLVDLAVAELHEWLLTHEDVVTGLIRDRAPIWTPTWFDDRVAARTYKEALDWVADVRDDPGHRMRGALDDVLRQFAQDLQTDPATIARAEALKVRLVDHPGLREAVQTLWASIRSVLEGAVEDPGSDLRRRVVVGVEGFGRRLATDAKLQATVDRYVEDAAGHLVSSYRDEVATVISDTVDRWDGEDASRRIELHVGRDLQFIRINGTVVGGLAGLVIHTVTVLAG
jgi:uncharacterized membrane-anchored protein YjiN (DUF445 family)